MVEHTTKRLLERFGMDYTKGLRDQLVGMIRNGKSEIVEKKSNNRTLHRIIYKKRSIVVVYDKSRKEIITVLNDYDEKHQLELNEKREKKKAEKKHVLCGEECIEHYQKEKEKFKNMTYEEWRVKRKTNKLCNIK